MGQLEKYGLYVLVVVIVMILGVALMGGDPASSPSNELAVADVQGVHSQQEGVPDPGAKSQPESGGKLSNTLFDAFDIDQGGGGFLDASTSKLGASKSKPDGSSRDESGGSTGPSKGAKSPEFLSIGADPSTLDPSREGGPSNGRESKGRESKGRETLDPKTRPAPEQRTRHLIASGDTLSSISSRYYGNPNSYQRILDANPGLNERALPLRKEIVIPAPPEAPKSTAADGHKEDKGTIGKAAPEGARVHLVVAGDTLGSIARTYLGSERHWQRIKDANPDVDERRLPLNHELVIPAAVVETARANPAPSARVLPSGAVLHRIQERETLTHISRRYYDSDHQWQRILDANPGLDPNRLRVGAEIVIPGAPPSRSL